MHNLVEVGALFELGRKAARGGARLQDEDGLGDDARHNERVGVLVVAERPRSALAVLRAVRRANPFRSFAGGLW